jgi:hypothetical protein
VKRVETALWILSVLSALFATYMVTVAMRSWGWWLLPLGLGAGAWRLGARLKKGTVAVIKEKKS